MLFDNYANHIRALAILDSCIGEIEDSAKNNTPLTEETKRHITMSLRRSRAYYKELVDKNFHPKIKQEPKQSTTINQLRLDILFNFYHLGQTPVSKPHRSELLKMKVEGYFEIKNGRHQFTDKGLALFKKYFG